MSAIEQIGTELAQLYSWADQAEEGPERSIFFGIDSLISRYRNLEEVISFFKLASIRDAAIASCIQAKRAVIVAADYLTDAPAIGAEAARSTAQLREFLLRGVQQEEEQLLASLLSEQTTERATKESVIQVLATQLSLEWRKHSEVDATCVASKGTDEAHRLHNDLNAIDAKIEALETAIASTRIRTTADLHVVLRLLANDVNQDWTDSIQKMARCKLWCDTLLEYSSRTSNGADDLLKHYRERD